MLLDDVAVGVVALAGYGGGGGVEPGGDVAVAVVGGDVGGGGAGDGGEGFDHEEAADSAGALQAAGEVEAPRVAFGVARAVVL